MSQEKRTIPRTCRQCGADFMARPSDVRRGHGLCCSRVCSNRFQRRPCGVVVNGDGTARIPLHARDGSIRDYAIIDADDAEWANQWRWCLAIGYARRSVKIGGRVHHWYLHRELLGLVPGDGFDIDHIDRNRLNNTRANLRVVPKDGNKQNVPSVKGTSSEHRGVSWHKRTKKWVAAIQMGGRNYHLGRFKTESEAAEVARAARLRMMPYATD